MAEFDLRAITLYMDRTTPRRKELEALMEAPEITADPRLFCRIAEEYRILSEGNALYQDIKTRIKEHETLSRALSECREEAERMLFRTEQKSVEDAVAEKTAQLNRILLPDIPDGEKDARVEIKTDKKGAGLLLLLLELYGAQAKTHGFLLTDLGKGESSAAFTVKGYGAYARFSCENGIHRLECRGKGEVVATVSAFPILSRAVYATDADDIRIDLFHSGGAGGQNVNKVQTAVRVTHLATGISVTCQDERSQLTNKQRALQNLREKLDAYAEKEREEKQAVLRKKQAKTGYTGSVRIYREADGTVTDVKTKLVAPLTMLMSGEKDFYTESAIYRKYGSMDD